ncbi:MAG TPA: energy transducer TonB [Sphingomonas sp.]|nr:energy transducer TonB [Sphingomonas sp.]
MLSLLLLAAAADPVALPPAGKWQVEYADMMCLLSRDYGAGPDKRTLALRVSPTNVRREITLIAPGTAMSDRGVASITLPPDGHAVTGTYWRTPLPGAAGNAASTFFADGTLDNLDKASAIDIRLDDEHRTLAVPGIAGALTALSRCQDDLLKSWGIDPAEPQREAVHVTGNPARFFGVTAYPPAAIAAHAQGRVVSVAGVDKRGGVTSCTVVVSSGNKALDDGTCRIIREQVHLIPARDKDGNAIASHYVLPVRWSLPGL